MKIIFIALSVFIAANIYGEDCHNKFEKWKKEYNKIESFSFKFKESTRYELLDREEKSEGEFYFHAPNLYKIEAKDYEILANNDYVYNYDKLNKQTTIQARERVSNPMEFIFLNRDLTNFFQIDSCLQNDKDTRFFLSKKEETQLPYLTIIITLHKKHIRSMSLTDYNNTTSTIEIEDFDDDQIKKSFFSYEKQLGVEEIKLY